MMQCHGSVLVDDPPHCDREATWHVCCADPTCSIRHNVCDGHEMEARLRLVDWVNEGGVSCRECKMPYLTVEHATSRWFRLPTAPSILGA